MRLRDVNVGEVYVVRAIEEIIKDEQLNVDVLADGGILASYKDNIFIAEDGSFTLQMMSFCGKPITVHQSYHALQCFTVEQDNYKHGWKTWMVKSISNKDIDISNII